MRDKKTDASASVGMTRRREGRKSVIPTKRTRYEGARGGIAYAPVNRKLSTVNSKLWIIIKQKA
ncbi:MAG: hypothetical protein LBK47_10915 [Prevotellaceae bacterium]|nr:hypothetical protein [Prevotellaceae bacterium]